MIDAALDHVAIAVHDIRAASRLYAGVMGGSFLFAGDNPGQGFRFAQFRLPAGGKIELVTPLGDGFVKRFLDRRGEGVHHITMKVPDMTAAIAHLEASNVPLFNVSVDRDEWKEAFIHPRDANGTLVQVAQSAWSDEEVAKHHLSDHSGSGHSHIAFSEL